MNTQGMKTLRFTVDLPSLFKEIASNSEVRYSPGAITGLEIIQKSLYRIATRAIEIQDTVILEELEVIGCIHSNTTEDSS